MLATILPALLLLTTTTTLACPPNTTTTTTPPPAPPPPCQTSYPSSLQMLNSRYPTYTFPASRFFMLARQLSDTFQVAMQIQFTDLPAAASNCSLHLAVPRANFTNIYGPQPVFNVYAVERGAGAPASWDTYAARNNESVPVFGVVDGGVEALNVARRGGDGVVEVGKTVGCQGTLTWQMGMKYYGGLEVNYWEFVDVVPPATPVQGWRVVHSC